MDRVRVPRSAKGPLIEGKSRGELSRGGEVVCLTSRDFVSFHHLNHHRLLPPFFHYCSCLAFGV